MTTADATRAQASQVAETATDQARDVMHQARAQAKSTARKVEDDLRTRANEEASKFAQTLHNASSQMESMAQSAGDDSMASNLVREGAQATRRLASHIDEGGLDRVMADVRSWARRNPGGFLLGAAFAGFVVGRVARNLSSAMSNDGGSQQSYDAYGQDFGYTPGTSLEYGEDAYPPTVSAGDVYPEPGATVGPTGTGGLSS